MHIGTQGVVLVVVSVNVLAVLALPVVWAVQARLRQRGRAAIGTDATPPDRLTR